jgi:hypothetical protein
MAAVYFGKVRLPIVAAFIGSALSLLVLYVMWAVWVHDVLGRLRVQGSYWTFIRHPVVVYRLMQELNRVGTWSYHGYVVKGAPLLVWWLGEAGLILAGGVLMPLKGIEKNAPICARCRGKCRSIGLLPRFAAEQQDEVIAAIESRDFTSLASFTAPEHDDDPELKLRLLSCGCGETNVLTLSFVAWTVNAQGISKVMTKPLVNELLITREETQQIRAAKETIEAEGEQDEKLEEGNG